MKYHYKNQENEPQLQERTFTPTDEIKPELIPAIEQLCIDKTAKYVDKLLAALSKKN